MFVLGSFGARAPSISFCPVNGARGRFDILYLNQLPVSEFFNLEVVCVLIDFPNLCWVYVWLWFWLSKLPGGAEVEENEWMSMYKWNNINILLLHHPTVLSSLLQNW